MTPEQIKEQEFEQWLPYARKVFDAHKSDFWKRNIERQAFEQFGEVLDIDFSAKDYGDPPMPYEQLEK